jgi:hypothetical protein
VQAGHELAQAQRLAAVQVAGSKHLLQLCIQLSAPMPAGHHTRTSGMP